MWERGDLSYMKLLQSPNASPGAVSIIRDCHVSRMLQASSQ